MSFPFVLSPYLRPILQDGSLAFDNGITGSAVALTKVQGEVVRVFDSVLDMNLPDVPFVDQVDLTNLCPMGCAFCPRGVPGRIKRPTGLMDLALFERLLSELHPKQALLGALSAMSNPPKIVVQMIRMQKNRDQQAAFLERFGSLGLQYVEAYLKPLDGPDPDLGRSISAPLVHLCSYPWRSVVMLWDGRVVPCCRDDDARLVLGDLHEQSLRDIWHSAEARALRASLRQGSLCPGHLCESCGWRRDKFAEAMPERNPERAARDPLGW